MQVQYLGPGFAPTMGKGRTLGAGSTGSPSEPWLVVEVVGVDGRSIDDIITDAIDTGWTSYTLHAKTLI